MNRDLATEAEQEEGPEDPCEVSATEGTFQRYDVVTREDGEVVGEASTNDSCEAGVPSEFDSWQVRYRSVEAMHKATGKSHTGINGCVVTVILDGVKI